MSYEKMKNTIRNKVMEDIDMSGQVTDDEIGKIIDKILICENCSVESLEEKVKLRYELFNSFRRLDVLTEFLEDEDVSEVMVNGLENIFIEKAGRLIMTDKHFEDVERLKTVIQQIVGDCNRRVNEADPIVDARLSDGSRVNVVYSPVSLDGPVITIRKFGKDVMSMERLCEMGALDEHVAELLELLVRAKYNIFISGGTGSGKTTFLNALSNYIPKDERIITIEDAAELKIQGVKNLVRLEARNENVEGDNAIAIRDLIKASLRMRPDRIIVGEVRDGAALDMLQAMGTGHDGSLSTGHANSARDMLGRLEIMTLMAVEMPVTAIRKQISSGLDIIVHLGRMRDKSRKVVAIEEVLTELKEGEIVLNRLYEFTEKNESTNQKVTGYLRKVNDLINISKLQSNGLLRVYEEKQRMKTEYGNV